MKNIFFFTAITFLTLSSCRKETVVLAEDQTSAKSQTQTKVTTTGSEGAKTSNSGGAVPFSDVFTVSLVGESGYNPCTSEVVTVISGNLLIDAHGMYNGSKSTITVHANVQGAKMVGESGREYVPSGSFNEQTSDFSNGVFTTKLVHFDRFITAGSENNFMIKDTYYIKVDAEGNATAIRDESHETYCQ